MIAAITTLLLLMAPMVAGGPTCPDWRALAEKAEDGYYENAPNAGVAAAFRRAAEAAECSNEPTELSDRLWRSSALWLSGDDPDQALGLIDQRLQLIRSEHGLRHPREAPYLWLEGRILGHERRELGRAEKALKRALEIMQEAHGDASAEVADAYRRLAYLYSDTGRKEAALSSIHLAIQCAERAGRSGRGALYEALLENYTILETLKTQPAELERVVQRMITLRKELEAEGWKPPEENY